MSKKLEKKEMVKLLKEKSINGLLELLSSQNQEGNIDWNFACTFFGLSECFMEEYASELDWEAASRYQLMSFDFMRKFKNEIVWSEATKTQILSEDFIEEMKDYIDWDVLLYSQVLSRDFLIKHVEKFSKWIENLDDDSSNKYSLSYYEDWYKTSEGSKMKNIIYQNLRNMGVICLHNSDLEEDFTFGSIEPLEKILENKEEK